MRKSRRIDYMLGSLFWGGFKLDKYVDSFIRSGAKEQVVTIPIRIGESNVNVKYKLLRKNDKVLIYIYEGGKYNLRAVLDVKNKTTTIYPWSGKPFVLRWIIH